MLILFCFDIEYPPENGRLFKIGDGFGRIYKSDTDRFKKITRP